MPEDDINYVKEVLQSELNYGFIGVMVFLMLVVSFFGFLPFLLAGEIACLFIAQNPRVQRLIRARKNKHLKLEAQDSEAQIIGMLPSNYQADFHSVRSLCDEIERRSNDLQSAGTQALLAGLVEKLSSFRYEYARMLRAHHLLSTRNYRNLQTMLAGEISRSEKAIEKETSPQVRHALMQNLNILKQRGERIKRLDELVRLLEARLAVVKNSLSLIQDEVYSLTDVAGISGLVDNLMMNLTVSDEFRMAYEDVLNVQADAAGIASLESMSLEPNLAEPPQQSWPQQQPRAADSKPSPREQIRRVK